MTYGPAGDRGALAPSAILYHPEGYDVGRPRLMGRHAAGAGFLDAYLTASAVAGEQPVCMSADQESVVSFEARRQDVSPNGPPSVWLPLGNLDRLGQIGCLYRPDPLLAGDAFRRRRGSQRRYSLTGVTHTVSSANAMDGLCDLVTAPLQSWDAVICTSIAVQIAVRRLAEEYGDYLKEAIGAAPSLRCQTPVIPLGVSLDAFPARASMAGARARRRAVLGLADDSVTALFVGRLSFHAKAHPGAMFTALQAAASQVPPGKLHLVLAGWFANESIERAFRQGAASLMPSVGLTVVDGRDPEIRRDIWYAADFFVSLADNIQETFGLTPIEAMAAGLPCIVTDWNGYRETVRHGLDGFRVPTATLAPGLDDALIGAFDLGLIDYDRFIGEASLRVAINSQVAAAACGRLASDGALRAAMGAAARRQAEELYSWTRVMAAYRELWASLAERRSVDAEVAPRRTGQGNPKRPDPFHLFSHYPTARLDVRTGILTEPGVTLADYESLSRLAMNAFGRSPGLDSQEVARLLEQAAYNPCTLADLSATVPPTRHDRLVRTVAFLAKLGLVRLIPDSGQGTSQQPPVNTSER